MAPTQEKNFQVEGLTDDEIRTLNAFAQHVEGNPESVVEKLNLPGDINPQMLGQAWAKISTASRQYVESGGRS